MSTKKTLCLDSLQGHCIYLKYTPKFPTVCNFFKVEAKKNCSSANKRYNFFVVFLDFKIKSKQHK